MAGGDAHPPANATSGGAGTRNAALIMALPEAVYRAFTDPTALPAWLAPDEMIGKVHRFDLRVGGGYEMSLYYPDASAAFQGKTAEREDRYSARFVALQPPRRIVEAIRFDTTDPAFSGEMVMEVTLTAANGGTLVIIAFTNMPPGIRPEDNEAGTRSSLEQLARYLAQAPHGN